MRRRVHTVESLTFDMAYYVGTLLGILSMVLLHADGWVLAVFCVGGICLSLWRLDKATKRGAS